MARENAEAKGRRYLAEGRLELVRVDFDTERPVPIAALCRGDGREYRLLYRAGDGWSCDCEARGRCAHLVALGLVVNLNRLGGR